MAKSLPSQSGRIPAPVLLLCLAIGLLPSGARAFARPASQTRALGRARGALAADALDGGE